MTYDVAALLLELAVKSALILGFAGIVASTARRWSAAERHLLWTCAFAALVALPLAIALVPTVRIAEPPWIDSPASSTAAGDGAAAAMPVAASADAPRVRAPAAPPAQEPTRSALATLLASAAAHAERLAAMVYAAVALLLLAALSLAALRAHRQIRALPPLADPDVLRLVAELGAAAGVRRPLRVVVSALDRTPWAWGARQPVVAVPAGFERWPAEEQRAALVHEIAHVARFDFAVTIGASACCALYWFNPLAWWSLARLRRDSELSCDDAVLASGASSARYAGQLLALARSIGERASGPPLGAPMAKASDVADRIASIVDPRRRRHRAAAATAVAALTAGLALPLAPLRSQSPIPALSQPSVLWRVDGRVIEVEHDGTRSRWTHLQDVHAFSADGRHIAIVAASGDERVRLLDAADGSVAGGMVFPKEFGLSYSVAFSSLGALAVGGYGAAGYLGASRSAPPFSLANDPAPPGTDRPCPLSACRLPWGAVAFSPDGALVAFQETSHSELQDLSYGFVYVVKADNFSRVAKLAAMAGTPQHVSFSPDGRRLLAMHYDTDNGRRVDVRLGVWDTSTWELVREIRGVGQGRGRDVVATGSAGEHGFVAVYPKDERLEMRDVERDRVVWSVPLYSPPFEAPTPPPWPLGPKLSRVALTPNGRLVVSFEGPGPLTIGGPEEVGAIVVRDARNGAIRAAYEIHDVTDIKISPDSTAFVYTVGFHQTYTALARLPL